MYNKLSASIKKKHHYDGEEGPPEKRLVSDADAFIKQLAEKQRNTKISLEEQLSSKQEFCKANDVVSITNFTSGSSSLKEFSSVVRHSDEIEKLQSKGLSNEDILLLFDYNNGEEFFNAKHKNINKVVLEEKLKHIFQVVNKTDDTVEKKGGNTDRLETELLLSTKPTSIETKLLKFALDNRQKCSEKTPHPMDGLNDIEKELVHGASFLNSKRIRRKARSLKRQIDAIDTSAQLKEPLKVTMDSSSSLVEKSQWDVKESHSSPIATDKKVYGCKPLNYYTIKNGEIVKLDSVGSSNKCSGNNCP